MIGILGGSFNPVHNGHLRAAMELIEELNLRALYLVPTAIPPHREQPEISDTQRLSMLGLAVAGDPRFIIDDREFYRDGPSYSLDTLQSFRAQCGPDLPLCFALGMDAFAEFHTWHRWQEILKYTHLVVMHRPGWDPQAYHDALIPELQSLLATHLVDDVQALREQASGRILMHAVTQLAISSSQIRALSAGNRSLRYLVPEAVQVYIEQHDLYKDVK